MKIYWKKLILSLAIPLATGGLSALLTKDSMSSFDSMAKPPLSPPSWVFPVVWTILFIMMGLAFYLVLISKKPSSQALSIYFSQLFFNFFWSIIFFNLKLYLFSFLWLVALWILILVNIFLFYKINKVAGYLLIPYLLWASFALYLNLAIYLMV